MRMQLDEVRSDVKLRIQNNPDYVNQEEIPEQELLGALGALSLPPAARCLICATW